MTFHYDLLIKDLFFLSSPFICSHLGFVETSYFFAGFAIQWVILNWWRGLINFKRYSRGEK